MDKDYERRKKAAWRAKYPEKDMTANARARAQSEGTPFTITHEDVVILDTCPALGIPLERATGKHHDGSPTLDRIIPEKGYVPGNIAVISYRANRIKNNSTVEELRAVAAWLRKRLDSQPT